MPPPRFLTHIRELMFLALAGVVVAGCSPGIYYPGACHENFKAMHQSAVGKSLDDPNNAYTAYRRYYAEYQTLPNGNVEYLKKDLGTCNSIYEINLNTRTIIGWRFEGTQKDCEICP